MKVPWLGDVSGPWLWSVDPWATGFRADFSHCCESLRCHRVLKREWPIGLTSIEETILKVLYFQTLMRHQKLELVIFLSHTPDRAEPHWIRHKGFAFCSPVLPQRNSSSFVPVILYSMSEKYGWFHGLFYLRKLFYWIPGTSTLKEGSKSRCVAQLLGSTSSTHQTLVCDPQHT